MWNEYQGEYDIRQVKLANYIQVEKTKTLTLLSVKIDRFWNKSHF